MKIFISVDIEGICGIANWDETTLNHPDYNYFRQEMTNEVIACCKALKENGVDEIYVRDAHDSARNIIPDQLPEYVKLIRGWQGSPCDMMAGLDKSFDGAILLGYHSNARSANNPLSHTLSTSVNHIKFNNKLASEFIINTYYAKTLNVPVIMVTGDEGLTKIVKEENSLIETVASFKGLNGAIETKHPIIVQKEIGEKVTKAIQNLKQSKDKLFVVMPRMIETEIHFRHHKKAYSATFYPNAYRINDDKTGFKSKDFMEVLKFLMFTM